MGLMAGPLSPPSTLPSTRPAAPPVDRHAQTRVDQRQGVGPAGLGRPGDPVTSVTLGVSLARIGKEHAWRTPETTFSHNAGSVPKSTPPLTFGQDMFSSKAAMPGTPSSRPAMATNSSVVLPAMLTITAVPRRGQVGQLPLEKGLDAVVIQPDRVEHAAGGFDGARRRIARREAVG